MKTCDYQNEPFECEICGGKYKRHHKTTHLKTKLHQQELQQES